MSKRSRDSSDLPRIIQEALRTVPMPRPSAVPQQIFKPPPRLGPDRVAQLLEENTELLNAIQQNLSIKRHKNCLQFQARLHHNLRLLAFMADSSQFVTLSLPPKPVAAEADAQSSRPLAHAQPQPTPARAASPVSQQQSQQPQPNVANQVAPQTAAASSAGTTDVGLQDLVAAIFPQISRRVAESSSSASILGGSENSNSGVGGNSNSAFRSLPFGPSEESLLGAGNSVGLPSNALPADFLNLESSTDRIWNALLPTSRQS